MMIVGVSLLDDITIKKKRSKWRNLFQIISTIIIQHQFHFILFYFLFSHPHFLPLYSDFDSLSKENVLHNNQLAFSIAEKQLGVPALLDAEDMVLAAEPDRSSIALYLSEIYECFEGCKKPNRRKSAIFNRSYSNQSSTSMPTSSSSTTTSPNTINHNNATTIKPVKFWLIFFFIISIYI